MARSYRRGVEFPHEGFVQLAVEEHFRKAGYILTTNGRVDLACTHPMTGDSWHIEAKGVTTQVGLDFRTGLGQLVQAMSSQTVNYGVAIPDTAAFRTQVAKLSPWVVATLRIHWLYVSEVGSVHFVPPPADV